MKPLIEAEELLKIYKNEHVFIAAVYNSKNAETEFEIQHLEKAVFIDLNKDPANIRKDFSNGEGTPYLRSKILEEHYQNLEFQMTLM